MMTMRKLAIFGAGLLVGSLLKRQARLLGQLGMVIAAGVVDAMVNWLCGPDPTPLPPRPSWWQRWMEGVPPGPEAKPARTR